MKSIPPNQTKTNLYEESIYPHADSKNISWISASVRQNVLGLICQFSGTRPRSLV